jgi:hypothetical protein
LIPANVVEAGFVVRVPQAYPVYDAGYSECVDVIRAWLERDVPNVHPVGRNGMHRYNNQDHSMLTAMFAVENIHGAHHDVWTVNVEEEYHESGNHEVGGHEAGDHNAGHHEIKVHQSKILDGVSGTGRATPELITRATTLDAERTTPRLTDKLAALSLHSRPARTFFRFGFRTILDVRRQVHALQRYLSPTTLLDRPAARRAGWALYRGAFSLSTIAWLRRLQFRLRDYASRNRRQNVGVEQLLIGGWNGMSASRFSEATGLLLDPSTRLSDSPQVDLLRRYDALGEKVYEVDILRETPYFTRIRAAARISGHHRGASNDDELIQLAREFVDRYRNLPIPYRPGRSSASSLPRVRHIRRSNCYEIRDGHHRLAIECARGATHVDVIVERPQSTTPIQRLLHKMSWLDGQTRLYQPVALPEVATWPLMRRCDDRLRMMTDFLANVHDAPLPTSHSYLDVGACYGWFVAAMELEGYNARGIEQDPLSKTLAALIYGIEPGRITVGDGVELLRQEKKRYEVVSCFSMLHHFVLGRGSCSAEDLIKLLDGVTGEVLFLDTGEGHESWFKLVLPEWTPKFTRQWILENTTFTNVRALGIDHDGVRPFEGKYGRTLFACTR